MLTLKVNGRRHRLTVDPETPLLWVLREHLGLNGTKYCCGIAECGSCMVLIDGEPDMSCIIDVVDAEGKEITTIEGLDGDVADAVRRAWLEEDVPQCGYCQSGQIIAATALLSANPNPSDDEISEAMSDVLCRCGTYPTIRRAIRKAAGRSRNET
ncbi:MAG: (2Fe-2S)-binding protein [Proteobacteria bacterium]|nr:(2Fe-2S)-binding protein [Pseudomonadota bacterium]